VINPLTDPVGRYVWALIFTGVIDGATLARATLTLGQRAELTRTIYRGLQQAGAHVSFSNRLPTLPDDGRD
jgi:hypothetical protein